jgi:hypothetical protein
MASNIRICLAAHEKWYGRAIRRVLELPVNHAFLLYQDPLWGGWWAADVLGRVVKIPAEEAKKRYSYIETYEPLADLSFGLPEIRNYVGTKYDIKYLLWGLFRIMIWRWLKIKITKPFHNISRVTCFELIAEFLKAAGVPETENWECSSVTPNDIRLFLKTSKVFKQTEYPV